MDGTGADRCHSGPLTLSQLLDRFCGFTLVLLGQVRQASACGYGRGHPRAWGHVGSTTTGVLLFPTTALPPQDSILMCPGPQLRVCLPCVPH